MKDNNMSGRSVTTYEQGWNPDDRYEKRESGKGTLRIVDGHFVYVEMEDGAMEQFGASQIRFDDVNGVTGGAGKYEVTFIPSIERGDNKFVINTSSLRESRRVFDAIANYTLFLHDESLMKDYSNLGFITKFNEETKEWDEIDHDHD